LLRSSNWRNCIGIMMGLPQRLQGSVASGGRSPGMKTLASHTLHVTILRGLSLMPSLIRYLNIVFATNSRRHLNAELLSAGSSPFVPESSATVKAQSERTSLNAGFLSGIAPFSEALLTNALTDSQNWCLIHAVQNDCYVQHLSVRPARPSDVIHVAALHWDRGRSFLNRTSNFTRNPRLPVNRGFFVECTPSKTNK
jgi:hypothetical protein